MLDKKKILIVSSSFYPSNSPRSLRTTELVKEFSRQGHNVTLLTVKENEIHELFEYDYGVTIKDLGPLRFPQVSLHNSSGIGRLFKRFIRRGLLQLFEYPNIELMYRVKKAMAGESDYDLLISIAVPYPIHWGVAWARQEGNPIAETWVADCGDPYYGLENDSFKPFFYFAWIEKWFCRKADYLTIPFEGSRSAYFEEFHSKIKVIPQGLSFPQKNDQEVKKNDVITFAYFGNIRSYLHYAIPFLKKLNKLEHDFKFLVYTKSKNVFVDVLDEKTLKKCEINSYVEREVLLKELTAVDFLVHFPYQKGTQKSLKLVDYNFLEKPILNYENDEYSDRVFKEFLKYDYTNRKEGEDFHKYKIENVCNQFLELADSKAQAVEQ